MPHIHTFIPMKLDSEQENSLVSRLGELISLIPGKSESGLMVSINKGKPLYLGGKSCDKAAYIEVKIFKDCPREAKNEFALATIKMLKKDWDIPEENIYINFFEVFNWAARGELLPIQ